ncbi:hypothetical protein HMN09_01067900 [Mycena chlorophos]|uniref:Uncharacterized protein n=1 Tax=Mycena chlorophos TaxID=658473 RepID=A0A8H6SCV6_MYCCL|nr:hypothetical protein HMN09_01067900 [Mycena chlorophos]
MTESSPLSLNFEKLASLQREHAQIDDLSIAAEFLSVLVAGLFLAAERPVDEDIDMASVASCHALLSEEPSLYEGLQRARLSNDLENFAHSALIPPLISSRARDCLKKFRGVMRRVTEAGGFQPMTWDPKDASHSPYATKNPLDEDTMQFLQALHLYRHRNTRIAIILHGLGGFRDDGERGARVKRIFTAENKFLVNSSGTGKTRLCYEGLCYRWGFYLSFSLDDGQLGSSDIGTLLGLIKGEYNIEKASARGGFVRSLPDRIQILFTAILLARLLLLLLYLDAAQADAFELPEDHKKTSLKLLVDNDETYLAQNVGAALRKVRKILGDQPLFFVLDESSDAVDLFSRYLQPELRNLLQIAIETWQGLLDANCTIICAGIGIPRERFSEGAGSDFAWTSDTGAFDDPAAQEAYVTPFLPPSLRDSDAGRALLARIWHWLRGRHRFTAKFVDILLNEGLNQPHKRFDDFIFQSLDFQPVDALEFSSSEPTPPARWDGSFFSVSASEMTEEDKYLFLSVLLRYMATHSAPEPLAVEQIQLVFRGLARFADTDLSAIALDEPQSLLKVAGKLFPYPEVSSPGEPNERPATFVHTLLRNPPQTAESLAHSLVFYLSQVLTKGKPLDAIFSFPHNPPSWAKQPAQLVRFYRSEPGGDALWNPVGANDFESFRPLATKATSVDDTLSWMEHNDGTAFCLPPSSSSVNLLFALRLADEKFVWVALKALVTNEPVQVAELQTGFSELRRESLLGELDKPVQTRLNDALKSLPKTIPNCKLLRVVSSFPRDITETVLDGSATPQMKSVAVVSLARFQSKSDQVMQTDFFDAIVAGVLAGHKRKSQWEPEDDHLFTSSKRLKRRAGDPRPLASWDGPLDEDEDDDDDDNDEPPPHEGKGKEMLRRPKSADAGSKSPKATVEGKGKAKALSEDHLQSAYLGSFSFSPFGNFFDAIVAGVLAGHKRKSHWQWEPEDGRDHLFTSSKRLKRDPEPLASWDGPINEDDDDEVAPVDKGKGRALPPRPRSADPRPESPEATAEGKGK